MGKSSLCLGTETLATLLGAYFGDHLEDIWGIAPLSPLYFVLGWKKRGQKKIRPSGPSVKLGGYLSKTVRKNGQTPLPGWDRQRLSDKYVAHLMGEGG